VVEKEILSQLLEIEDMQGREYGSERQITIKKVQDMCTLRSNLFSETQHVGDAGGPAAAAAGRRTAGAAPADTRAAAPAAGQPCSFSR
jgi:hypothetical protein